MKMKNKKNRWIKGLLLSSLLTLLQCTAPKETAPAASPPLTAAAPDAPVPVVITVLLKVEAGTLPVFSLENVIRAEGQLKEASFSGEKQQPQDGYLLSVINESGQVLARETLPEDPLVRRLEFADETGKMSSREVRLEEEWIAIRVQDPGTSLLCRIERLQAGQARLILQFPIP